MNKPVATLLVAYEDLDTDPVYVDESDYLRGYSIRRGRNNELDQQQAGTCTLVLDNRDGRFDPLNASGANYPNVLPMRRVILKVDNLTETVPATFTLESDTYVGDGAHAVEAGDGSAELYLFSGFFESVSETWATTNGDANVTIQCTDGFKLLNLITAKWGFFWDSSTLVSPPIIVYSSTYIADVLVSDTVADGSPYLPQVLYLYGAGSGGGGSNEWMTGDDAGLVLDTIHWPGDRRIDHGTIPVMHATGSSANIPINDNALTYLQKLAETEGGLFYIGADGAAVFLDADRFAGVPSITLEIYGGQTGEIGYADIAVEYNDSRLYNVVTVSAGDQVADAEDAASIAAFGMRSLDRTILEVGEYPSPSVVLAQERADELLARYKDPQVRITSLTVSPTHSDDWFKVLSHELGDYLRVKKRPATADEIDQTLRIEGISIQSGSFDLDQPSVTFSLSS